MLRFAAVLLIATGCAKDLSELEPYPCATNIPRCPEGRACLGGLCQRAVVDQPCNDFVDCSLGAPDAVCTGGACKFDDSTFQFVCVPGLCAQPCSEGTCDSSHTCDPTLGVCLANCTDSCPARSTCRALGTQTVCYPNKT